MTKREIALKMRDAFGIPVEEAKTFIDYFMDIVKESLQDGEPVFLRGFGTFLVKERAEKLARDISKDTPVIVPARRIPAFKPCKEFKGSIE